MNKRERLEKTLAGEETDRIPVALWRHWPGDDQRAADLARSIIEFQKTYDWDVVKVTPASSYSVAEHGVQDEWRGNLEGTRYQTKFAVKRSLDWTELRPLDPMRGEMGKQLECVRLIGKGLEGDEAPIIQTIFSPLSQARKIAGNDQLLRHMRTHPDRLHTGLNIITESTLRFLDALKQTPISGIFYAVQHASYELMPEEEYRVFGLPYDLKILGTLPEQWWFNMLHIHGTAPMFKLLSKYPVQSINWHDREDKPTLEEGQSMYKGIVCGGLARGEHVHDGTPATIRDVARDAMEQTGGRRFMLATGCVTLITSPWSNIRAVRDLVEKTRL